MNASFFVSEGEVGEQAPEGSHVARCIAVIDLGTQTNEYNGEVKSRRALWIQWELPDEVRQSGQFAGECFRVGSIYTRSLHPKASLRSDLESWRGRAFTTDELKQFDIAKLLGAPCLLQVGRNEKGRAKVGAVMSVPKGMVVPPQINGLLLLSLDQYDQHVFAELPKGIQAMIAASPEYDTATRARTQPVGDRQPPARNPAGSTTTTAAESTQGDAFAEFADDDIPF